MVAPASIELSIGSPAAAVRSKPASRQLSKACPILIRSVRPDALACLAFSTPADGLRNSGSFMVGFLASVVRGVSTLLDGHVDGPRPARGGTGTAYLLAHARDRHVGAVCKALGILACGEVLEDGALGSGDAVGALQPEHYVDRRE